MFIHSFFSPLEWTGKSTGYLVEEGANWLFNCKTLCDSNLFSRIAKLRRDSSHMCSLKVLGKFDPLQWYVMSFWHLIMVTLTETDWRSMGDETRGSQEASTTVRCALVTMQGIATVIQDSQMATFLSDEWNSRIRIVTTRIVWALLIFSSLDLKQRVKLYIHDKFQMPTNKDHWQCRQLTLSKLQPDCKKDNDIKTGHNYKLYKNVPTTRLH